MKTGKKMLYNIVICIHVLNKNYLLFILLLLQKNGRF